MSLANRPKRRAATNVAKIIEISDSDEDAYNEDYVPEKRQRTTRVIVREPVVSNEKISSSKPKKDPKPRKPRAEKKTKKVTNKNDENTAPNTIDLCDDEVEEVLDTADGQCLEPETENAQGLNNESMHDVSRASIQGRNSFWGEQYNIHKYGFVHVFLLFHSQLVYIHT